MKPTITQTDHHFLKKFQLLALVFATFCLSCQSDGESAALVSGKVYENFKNYQTQQLATPTGALIKTYIARTAKEQTQGLSGVKPDALAPNEGMLFVYPEMGPRGFWMPNTFIDLDIFFLDSEYTIIHVERKVPAHPGMKEPPMIARTPVVVARYVLELASTSPMSHSLKVGQKLSPLKKTN